MRVFAFDFAPHFVHMSGRTRNGSSTLLVRTPIALRPKTKYKKPHFQYKLYQECAHGAISACRYWDSVLVQHLGMRGTDLAYAATCHATCGTELAYGTELACRTDLAYGTELACASPIVLRLRYALSGTDIRHAPTRRLFREGDLRCRPTPRNPVQKNRNCSAICTRNAVSEGQDVLEFAARY
eukprot:3819720-Rhodomonas_salina.5